MRRYALRDDQWDRIKHLLPGKFGDRGRTAGNNRLFVEAVLYRYRTGIPGAICLRDLVIFPRYPHPPYALEQSWRLGRSFQALKPR